MTSIDLAGFSAKFAGDDDPWRTFTARDEAVKRAAILHALGPGPIGRVLELASGNGSNSVALAPRSLRLDATEGTREGTALTARAIARYPHAHATLLPLPARPPLAIYDAVVVAEILYYLSERAMRQVACDVATWVRPGGKLVLAHHHVDFFDFAQPAAGIQDRFLAQTGRHWTVRSVRRTGKWIVCSARLLATAV